MNLARNLGRLGVAGLVLLTVFMVLQLGHKASVAYARRNKPAAAAPTEAPAWRQSLYFDHATAPPGALVKGWSPPEPGSGAWSDGPLAILRLPAAPISGPAAAALKVEPFIAPGRPFQRVTARVGERTLGEWRLTKAEATTLYFQVPAELRDPAGEVTVQLDLPDSDSPARRVEGALDARLLGVKLHEITVTG